MNCNEQISPQSVRSSENYKNVSGSEDESRSSIEVVKNTKGYNWSCKFYFNRDKETPKGVIEEITKTETNLKERFGSEAKPSEREI